MRTFFSACSARALYALCGAVLAAALLGGCTGAPDSSPGGGSSTAASSASGAASQPADASSQPAPASSSESVPAYVPAEGDITEEQALQIWEELAPLYAEYINVFYRDDIPHTSVWSYVGDRPYQYELCGESVYDSTDDLRALLNRVFTPEKAALEAEYYFVDDEYPYFLDYEGKLYRAFVEWPNDGVDDSIPGRLLSSSDTSFVLELQTRVDCGETTPTEFTIRNVDGVWLIDNVRR